jgi:archaellin
MKAFRQRSRRGDISIAMLIVQISAILFAAIAIYFIIQDIGMTENAVELSHDAAFKTAKTGFIINDVRGLSTDQDTSDSEALIMTVSSLPGSDPINLNTTIFYIQMGNRTARLNFRNGTTEKDMESGFYTE